MDQVYGVPVIYEGSGARSSPGLPPGTVHPAGALYGLAHVGAGSASSLNLAPAAHTGAFFHLPPPRTLRELPHKFTICFIWSSRLRVDALSVCRWISLGAGGSASLSPAWLSAPVQVTHSPLNPDHTLGPLL